MRNLMYQSTNILVLVLFFFLRAFSSVQAQQDPAIKVQIIQLNKEGLALRDEGNAHWKKAEEYNKWKADLMRRDPYGESSEFRDHVQKAKELNAIFQDYGRRRADYHARIKALQIKLLQPLIDAPKNEQASKETQIVYDDFAKKGEYEKKGNQTYCSDFVRDVVTKRLGFKVPELEGQAKDQFDKLSLESKDFYSSWKKLHFNDDPQQAMTNAQKLANQGRVVVVAWKNPNWQKETTNTGHVAMIAPGDKLTPSTSWSGMRVPNIAQAGGYTFENGKTVTGSAPLSYGFSVDKKAGMEIFVYDRSVYTKE